MIQTRTKSALQKTKEYSQLAQQELKEVKEAMRESREAGAEEQLEEFTGSEIDKIEAKYDQQKANELKEYAKNKLQKTFSLVQKIDTNLNKQVLELQQMSLVQDASITPVTDPAAQTDAAAAATKADAAAQAATQPGKTANASAATATTAANATGNATQANGTASLNGTGNATKANSTLPPAIAAGLDVEQLKKEVEALTLLLEELTGGDPSIKALIANITANQTDVQKQAMESIANSLKAMEEMVASSKRMRKLGGNIVPPANATAGNGADLQKALEALGNNSTNGTKAANATTPAATTASPAAAAAATAGNGATEPALALPPTPAALSQKRK